MKFQMCYGARGARALPMQNGVRGARALPMQNGVRGAPALPMRFVGGGKFVRKN